MFRPIKKLPKDVTVAFSGGVDSVAITDYLLEHHNVTCAFFNHGTEDCDNAEEFAKEFCDQRGVGLLIGKISRDRMRNESLEEYWREERYKFLHNIDSTIVTGHNLDDCVETYIFSCLHGTPKLIPYTRNNIVRSFLTTRKSAFIDRCTARGISWYEDTTNSETNHMRNYIRHNIIADAVHVNAGLHNMIRRKLLKKITECH